MTATISYHLVQHHNVQALNLLKQEFPDISEEELSKCLVDVSGYSENERIPLSRIKDCVQIISSKLKDPLWSIKVVDKHDIFYSPLVNIIKSQFKGYEAKSFLAQLIIFLSEYMASMTEEVDIRLSWYKGQLGLSFIPGDSSVTRHQLEAAVFGVSKIIRALTQCHPVFLGFNHQAASNEEHYKSYFKIVPQFDCEVTSLIYETTYPPCHIQEASIRTVSGLNTLLNNELPNLSAKEKSEIILKSTLHFGGGSRERVSDLMGIGMRTLQRKLENEGTSFKDVLLDLRRKMSIDLLVSQDISASQVSFLLGYRDAKNFYRSFSGWYGMPPGEFKKLKVQRN